MKFNPLPEEQGSPQLVQQLKEIYHMKTEDRESLRRIEAQVTVNMRSRLRRRPRWQHSLNLVAAAIVVVLITGAAAALFAARSHSHTASHLAGASTPGGSQVQPTTHTIHQPIYLTSGRRLALISDQVSWVIGSDAHTTDWSELLRTTDGGKTWQRVKLPAGSSALGYTVVIDDVTALVPVATILSNKYWITFDGGSTWQHFDLPVAQPGLANDAEPNLITFLDHSQAWIIEPGSAGSSAQKVLFHTGDAGKSWQKVATLPINDLVRGFVFTDTQTGWLAVGSWGNGSTLYATHDGGQTWQQQELPAPPSGSKTPNMLFNLTFTSTRDGSVFFVAGKDAGKNVYLYTTQNGGQSWQIRGGALPDDSGFGKLLDPSHISAGLIDLKTQQPIVALLTLSHNRWTEKSLKPDVEDFDFVSPQIAFALVKLDNQPLDWYRTDDGGQTWVKVGPLP